MATDREIIQMKYRRVIPTSYQLLTWRLAEAHVHAAEPPVHFLYENSARLLKLKAAHVFY